jgi:hypothetical protein
MFQCSLRSSLMGCLPSRSSNTYFTAVTQFYPSTRLGATSSALSNGFSRIPHQRLRRSLLCSRATARFSSRYRLVQSRRGFIGISITSRDTKTRTIPERHSKRKTRLLFGSLLSNCCLVWWLRLYEEKWQGLLRTSTILRLITIFHFLRTSIFVLNSAPLFSIL